MVDKVRERTNHAVVQQRSFSETLGREKLRSSLSPIEYENIAAYPDHLELI